MKILIVEDVCMIRKLLERLLSLYGKCESVGNGRDALIKFNQTCLNDENYYIIFLDLMLPLIYGDKVLRNIRESEQKMSVLKKIN